MAAGSSLSASGKSQQLIMSTMSRAVPPLASSTASAPREGEALAERERRRVEGMLVEDLSSRHHQQEPHRGAAGNPRSLRGRSTC